ncbi:MAG: hypothetical protein IAB19_03505 [Proteobacteria bacterium]|uniref:Uncharacterized protein n=1 Tax=Candidatus Avisuccinivibrio stercorigallinarum TaxID=2840704 RepID=A0A9D9GNY8_9GAMM|nr:hypothetical protein [Candidatus Avisuccinivibrio stercorigallinarum]
MSAEQQQQNPEQLISPRERSLLEELVEIKELSRQLIAQLGRQNEAMAQQQKELNQARRSMIELKEENSHLREVLQTWRTRMDNVISQLRSPD